MIIQCPACQARARISDSQEGAKVRCGECGRIFVAGQTAARGRSSSSGNKAGLWIGMGAGGIAVLFLLVMLSKGKGSDYSSAKPKEDPIQPFTGSAVDSTSFEHSKEIRAAVRMHEDAANGLVDRVQLAMHGPRVYAWKKSLEVQAAAEGDEEVEITAQQRAGWEAEFQAMPAFEQTDILGAYAESMCRGEERDLVADWKPYDGEIISSDDTIGEAVVRLQVMSRTPGSAENRNIQWTLVEVRDRWKVVAWERWYTIAEKNAMRRKRGRGYEKVTLSDGSVVHEREPEPLPHLDDTPADLRKKIDDLIATMIDLDLTREATQARNALVEVGRPAIPRLLTKLFEIPLDNEDHSIQINQVVVALREITGQNHGYEPQEFLGSGTGTTKERRESSIKQWFAWWHRKQRTFVEKEEGTDALEALIEQSEKEKDWLDRNDG